MNMDQQPLGPAPSTNSDFLELDKALQQVRNSLEGAQQQGSASRNPRVANNSVLKRHHSLPHGQESRPSESTSVQGGGPVSSRTRRALQNKSNPSNRYETPNEEEELLDEALTSAHKAAKKLDKRTQPPANTPQRKTTQQQQADLGPAASYLTPSPSANRNGVKFGQYSYATPTKPLEIQKNRPAKEETVSKWPTPPYDENDWASSVAASLLATQSMYR